MNLKDFLTSRIFVKQLIASIAITLALVLLILLSLRLYTRHGRDFPVPDVFGMTEDEYSETLDDVHLKFRVVDTAYNINVKPGGVIDQIPEAGHKVKRNRTILLTINATSPGKVALPKVTDISYRQAAVQLESAGLFAGKVTYEPSEFQNLVLKATLNGREIFEGEMVTKGTVIDLVLGSGEGGDRAFLPDLKGLSMDEANNILAGASFRFGSVIYDETVITASDSLVARIFRQNPDPEYSALAFSGSAIDVWLSADPSKYAKKETEKQEVLDF